MSLVIYDPLPSTNDYLSSVYFSSLYAYAKDNNLDCEIVRDNLLGIKNKKILIDATNLGKEYPVKDNSILVALKNNGNSIYCFDINDHSSLGFYEVDISMIDFLFKIAGIQDTDFDNELYISNDLTYSIAPKHFLEPSSINHVQYTNLIKENKIMSLPYVLDDAEYNIGVNYEQRVKKCLVRGGAHFKRIHLFFNLLKNNLADSSSSFDVTGYKHSMCDECVNITNGGNFTLDTYRQHRLFDCKNPVFKWQEEMLEGCFNSNRWAWNNRCYPMYYWLMDKFISKYGQIDVGVVEAVFNNPRISSQGLNSILGRYLFYGDFKWIHSVYAPQRFWQAARCNCINLLPERAASQSYFPVLKKDEHFITFKEDFSDLDKLHNVTKEQYEYITNNCFELYNKYIKIGRYKLSTNLMDEIFNKING